MNESCVLLMEHINISHSAGQSIRSNRWLDCRACFNWIEIKCLSLQQHFESSRSTFCSKLLFLNNTFCWWQPNNIQNAESNWTMDIHHFQSHWHPKRSHWENASIRNYCWINYAYETRKKWWQKSSDKWIGLIAVALPYRHVTSSHISNAFFVIRKIKIEYMFARAFLPMNVWLWSEHLGHTWVERKKKTNSRAWCWMEFQQLKKVGCAVLLLFSSSFFQF